MSRCCLCKQDAVLFLKAPIAVDIVPAAEPDTLEFEFYCERFPTCNQHFQKLVTMEPRVRANLLAVLKFAKPSE